MYIVPFTLGMGYLLAQNFRSRTFSLRTQKILVTTILLFMVLNHLNDYH